MDPKEVIEPGSESDKPQARDLPQILRSHQELLVRPLQFPEIVDTGEPLFRRIALLDKLEMLRLNLASPGLVNDTIADIKKMLSLPGANVALLERETGPNQKRAVGFGTIFTDKYNFPDTVDIPAQLMLGNVCRINRLFVSEEARKNAPRGEAFASIIGKLIEIADGRQIIAKVLVGPDTIAKEWLVARTALEQKGFQTTGFKATHIGKNGQLLLFEWWIFPPFTDEGRLVFDTHRTYFKNLKIDSQARVASSIANFPITDGKILCISRHKDGYDLAAMFPGNYILDVEFSGNQNPGKEKEMRHNLVHYRSKTALPDMPPESVDGFFVCDVLADVALGDASAPKDCITTFFAGLVAQLKLGQRAVVQDGFLSQAELQEVLSSLGVRIVSAAPEKNGRSQIVFEKVDPNDSVQIIQSEVRAIENSGFLTLRAYAPKPEMFDGGLLALTDMASRPNPTLDVVPYCVVNGQFYVIIKDGYPRGISQADRHPIDGSHNSGYFSEQIGAVVDPRILDEPDRHHAEIRRILWERAGISADQIVEIGASQKYYTEPTSIDEQVLARRIKIEPMLNHRRVEAGYSHLSTSGVVKPVRADQHLASCQIGSVENPRSERVIYDLLISENMSVGLWLGEEPKLYTADTSLEVSQAQTLFTHEPVKAFEQVGGVEKHFHSVLEGEFVEQDKNGNALQSVRLNYVVPNPASGLGSNAVAVLPVIQYKDFMNRKRIAVGLEIRDLPAVQEHSNTSKITCSPIFRLPKTVDSLDEARQYTVARMKSDFGVEVVNSWSLGGKYYPSIGISPQVTYPYLMEVSPDGLSAARLKWVDLEDLIENRDLIRHGDLLTLAFRGAHSLGLLKE